MLAIGGGGGGGHFVGLQPQGAGHLATSMVAQGARGLWSSARIDLLLAQAGADAGPCATPTVLQGLNRWLQRGAGDVRWRVELVAGDAGAPGMAYGYLDFASAAVATAAGRRHANELAAAATRWFVADSDEERAAAEADYLALLQAVAEHADDSAWAGGLLNRLGTDGISNALWLVGSSVESELEPLRERVGPLFGALATGMRHHTVHPTVRRDLLRWPGPDLATIVALAPADTTFLTTVARQVLIASQVDGDMANDPTPRELALVYGALADDSEAAFRVLTHRVVRGPGDPGLPASAYLLPWNLTSSPQATQALARVLQGGLVEYPAGQGAREWNLATAATEAFIHGASQLGHLVDDADPALSAAMVSLLRPHLDAVATIGARAGGMTTPGGFDVPLPGGRRALDVDADTLRRYLGAAMEDDAGIAHMQLLLAAYAQDPQTQAHRLPMLTVHDTRDLNPFFADSVRIAGLVGMVGAGLDEAGKDEEATTRLLVGALDFAAGKGAGRIVSGSSPVSWLAQRGVRYLAGQGVDEVEQWLQTREPLEGEAGVDTYLESYVDTTVASLREHIATDPELSRLPVAEREGLLESVAHLVEHAVGGPLRVSYADLVAETAGG